MQEIYSCLILYLLTLRVIVMYIIYTVIVYDIFSWDLKCTLIAPEMFALFIATLTVN